MRRRRFATTLAFALVASGCAQPHRGPVESAAPTGHGETVYVAGERGTIDAIGRDGALRWHADVGAELADGVAGATSDVTILELAASGDDVVALVRSDTGATAGTNTLVVVGSNGAVRWQHDVAPPADASRPFAVERAIYVVFADGTLGAFALADGKPLWSFAVSGAGPGSPHVGADGTVYVRGANGRVHAVGPDGAERWVYPSG